MKDPLPHFRLTAGAARKAFTAASKRVSMKSFCARQVVLGRKCRWTFCLVRRPQSVSRHLPVKCPPKKCMTMTGRSHGCALRLAADAHAGLRSVLNLFRTGAPQVQNMSFRRHPLFAALMTGGLLFSILLPRCEARSAASQYPGRSAPQSARSGARSLPSPYRAPLQRGRTRFHVGPHLSGRLQQRGSLRVRPHCRPHGCRRKALGLMSSHKADSA